MLCLGDVTVYPCRPSNSESCHRPHSTTTVKQYEEALLRFQQHFGQQDPLGFRGSASFRVADLPWLGNQPGYEDWCLLDGSWALDPLNSGVDVAAPSGWSALPIERVRVGALP